MNDESSGGGHLVLKLKWALPWPRERIFRMLTEPAELAKWWGPRGFTMPGAELRLAVGGSYRFTMKPPGGEVFHLSGELLEIQPASRLVYTFRWDEPTPDDRQTVVELSLEPVGAGGAGTEVSLSQGFFATEERRALHEQGWSESFEKLREVLERG